MKGGAYKAKTLRRAVVQHAPKPRKAKGDMAGHGPATKWTKGGEGKMSARGPGFVNPPFKAGHVARDFFDPSLYMSDPVPDETAPPVKVGKWRSAGKGGRTFAAPPRHVPDPYGLPEPPGAESRGRGTFGLCCVSTSGTSKPIAWYNTRTGDVYRTRNLKAAAAASGMPTNMAGVSAVNVTREKVSAGNKVVTFNWST